MTDLFLAGGIALLVAMVATPLLISWLRVRGIGQQIREDGPVRHLTKAGTPTMGGVAIIGAAVIGYLVEHVEGHLHHPRAGRHAGGLRGCRASAWSTTGSRCTANAASASTNGPSWPDSSSSPSPSRCCA